MESIKPGRSQKINRVLRPMNNINSSLQVHSIKPGCTPSYSSRNLISEEIQMR